MSYIEDSERDHQPSGAYKPKLDSSGDSRWSRFKNKWNHFRNANPRMVNITLWILVVLISVVVWQDLPEKYKGETTQHVLMTLLAVIFIHLLDRWHISKDFTDAMKHLFSDFRKESSKNHKSTKRSIEKLIQATGETLEALFLVGAKRVYPTRKAASKDICEDLEKVLQSVPNKIKALKAEIDGKDTTPTVIRLMGVSLNDIIQKEQLNLGRVWEQICELIDGHSAKQDGAGASPMFKEPVLEVQILVVHPDCLGAELRSSGEQRAGSSQSSRLRSDVTDVSKMLFDFQVRTRYGPVRLSCRLYQIPPTCFMCWMEDCCYVEPYFFWNQRHHINVPVGRFANDTFELNASASDADRQIHQQLRHHFDWIWEKVSINVADLVQGHSIGVDKALRQTSTVNIFNEKSQASDRMCHLLSSAGSLPVSSMHPEESAAKELPKPDVWIIGISLQAFFGNSPLGYEMAKLIKDGQCRIHVLLIDPDSPQARWRAYREECVNGETIESYGPEISSSRLAMDTAATFERICRTVEDVRRKKDVGWSPLISVRKYKSDPTCFLLGVGDHVLYEPYHYGRSHAADGLDIQAILGKEMPVFEFQRRGAEPDVFATSDEQMQRQPFLLLADHFKFVWDRATPMPLVSSPPSGGAPPL